MKKEKPVWFHRQSDGPVLSHLTWAHMALELVRNGLKNRRKLAANDVEMINLDAAQFSLRVALTGLRKRRRATSTGGAPK